MRSTLTFAAIGAGLAATLVFGAQMGLMVGLMVFLVGNNALLTKDLDRLKAHLDKVLNELPTLVSDLVKQRLSEHDASSPLKESIPTPEVSSPPARESAVDSAVPALEQRISSLDSKLETLIFQLASTHAPTPPPPPPPAAVASPSPMQAAPATPIVSTVAVPAESRLIQPAPVPIPQAQSVQSIVQAPSVTEPAAEQASSLMDALRQEAPAPGEHVSATAELAAMRELMLLMTSMLSQNAQMGKMPSQVDRSAHAPPASPVPAAVSVQTVSVEPALDPGPKKPSIDRLRAELDKLAQELRTELDRPKR